MQFMDMDPTYENRLRNFSSKRLIFSSNSSMASN
jgi:hypothetical protein